MRKQLRDRLPEFSEEEAALVKGSNDFYGMNHYCANYIKHKDTEPELNDHAGNLEALMQNKKGEWIGPETQSVWLRPMPLGFRKLIKWLSDRYGGPIFYVTENGTSLKGENELPLEQLLDDEFRVEYFRGYIGALADAHTLDGVDVRGYSAWSLMEYVLLISYLPASVIPVRPRATRTAYKTVLTHAAVTSSGPRVTRPASASPTSTTRGVRRGTPRRARVRFQRSSTIISKRSRQFLTDECGFGEMRLLQRKMLLTTRHGF
jgi:hypothetical protein